MYEIKRDIIKLKLKYVLDEYDIIFCKTSKVLSGKEEDLDLLEDKTGNDILYFEYY